MVVSPGPLQIVSNDRGEAYFLRIPAGTDKRGLPKGGSAVATVWRMRPHREAAAGNAVAMAHAEELIRLLRQYREATNKAEKTASDVEYDRLDIDMLSEWTALRESGERPE